MRALAPPLALELGLDLLGHLLPVDVDLLHVVDEPLDRLLLVAPVEVFDPVSLRKWKTLKLMVVIGFEAKISSIV